jgi:hypothetical protein
MYFADLSPCRYYGLSVGWLEKGHDFVRGAVPSGFLDRLLERCRQPEIRHRGAHFCEFCPTLEDAHAALIRELPGGERVRLGSGAIRVHPKVGLAFVAPTLIYHYVEAHGYLPSEGFIEAVMQDNPENAETRAERYRFGATILSRIAMDFLEVRERHKPRH